MTAGEMDMDKTDFGLTQASTFDHHGSKITAFFIQVRDRDKYKKGKYMLLYQVGTGSSMSWVFQFPNVRAPSYEVRRENGHNGGA